MSCQWTEHKDQGRDGPERLSKIRLNVSSLRHSIILCQTTGQFSVNSPIKVIIPANYKTGKFPTRKEVRAVNYTTKFSEARENSHEPAARSSFCI